MTTNAAGQDAHALNQILPPESREILDSVEQDFGFIPNIYRALAATPAALDALAALNTGFARSGFTPAEREIAALTTSVFNRCAYCVAAHSGLALAEGVDPRVIEAVRCGGVAPDTRLEALHRMTLAVLESRGELEPAQVRAFLNAGFQAPQIMELLIGIAAKVMTNFASKIAHLPLDDAFADQAWEPQ